MAEFDVFFLKRLAIWSVVVVVVFFSFSFWGITRCGVEDGAESCGSADEEERSWGAQSLPIK